MMDLFSNKTMKRIISILVMIVSAIGLTYGQGMTVHVNNGEKVMLNIEDMDSITFSTDKNFKSEFPRDTVTIEVTKEKIVTERVTDTVYVIRENGEVVRPYKEVKAVQGKQYDMAKWNIPAGNYSGIAWMGDNRYAMVSDKQERDGWIEVTIDIDSITGEIADMGLVERHFQSGISGSARDAEGIALFQSDTTLFVAAESDQRIIELDLEGNATGRELMVPKEMSSGAVYGNYGFESIAYGATTHRFWTTTENVIKHDGNVSDYANRVPAMLRVLSFDDRMECVAQYAYATDVPTTEKTAKLYAFGVPALTVMDDGSLLVLEREFYVANNYLGSFVTNKLYRTEPLRRDQIGFDDDIHALDDSKVLKKTLLTEFTTNLNLLKMNIANYEGMCMGPTLKDGSRALILVSDSQDNYGNALYHLKDYIKTIKIYSNL